MSPEVIVLYKYLLKHGFQVEVFRKEECYGVDVYEVRLAKYPDPEYPSLVSRFTINLREKDVQ